MAELECIELQAVSRPVRPIDEFRRWMIVIGIMAIAGSGLIGVAARPDLENVLLPVVSIFLWACLAAGESWIQFRHLPSRLAWIVAGAATGGWLILSASFSDMGVASRIGLFLIPAGIECASAWKFRRHPWVWLIVTPLLYVWANWWVPQVGELGEKVILKLQHQFGFTSPVSSVFAAIACVLGTAALSRALVGSFIARRREGE